MIENAHIFQEYTYKKITPCDICSQILRGKLDWNWNISKKLLKTFIPTNHWDHTIETKYELFLQDIQDKASNANYAG